MIRFLTFADEVNKGLRDGELGKRYYSRLSVRTKKFRWMGHHLWTRIPKWWQVKHFSGTMKTKKKWKSEKNNIISGEKIGLTKWCSVRSQVEVMCTREGLKEEGKEDQTTLHLKLQTKLHLKLQTKTREARKKSVFKRWWWWWHPRLYLPGLSTGSQVKEEPCTWESPPLSSLSTVRLHVITNR